MATSLPTSAVDVSSDIERFYEMGLLNRLLKNRSTDRNIIWASNVFIDKGDSYAPADEILASDIAGKNAGLIRTRASKEKEAQTALTRAHAEVFTPTWVVKKMIDAADEAWWEAHEDATWLDYVCSPRLEITCGEAPYLVNRYDAATGAPIDVADRIGILDRKLALVAEHVTAQKTWAKYAHMALQSTYGYEFQGDNLLIARVNVLATLEEFARDAGYTIAPSTYDKFVFAISWNLWQMNGLNDLPPEYSLGEVSDEENVYHDIPLPGFDELFDEEVEDDIQHPTEAQLRLDGACIYDWNNSNKLWFSTLKGEGSQMKFDYVIGNPPYQEEQAGDNRTYAPPIYHLFIDESYKVGHTVELIHPARFLFNAGSTPKAWNRKMLHDPHLKVLYYEDDSSKVFPTTDIKGGIAITLHDVAANYGEIGQFIVHDEMRNVVKKVESISSESLSTIILASETYKFTDTMHHELSNVESLLSKGHKYDLKTSVFSSLSELVFFEKKPNDDYVRVLGLINGQRCYRWIKKSYLRGPSNFNKYKVFVPAANGSGVLGEALSSPVVAEPLLGHTQTFISIGSFDNKESAVACLKYIKTKFARLMLGVLKKPSTIPAQSGSMFLCKIFLRIPTSTGQSPFLRLTSSFMPSTV